MALLADPEAELPADKVLLRRAGQVRLAADGPIAAANDVRYVLGNEAALTVAGVAAEQVRVVSTWGNARLLLWVERGDLADVAVREAMLEGGAPPRGVTLRAGARIELVERSGGRVRVRWADEELAFEGWVAAEAVGHVFRPGRPAEPLPTIGTATLRCRTELSASPGGQAVAILAPQDTGACKEQVEVDLLSEPQGGRAEVALQRPAYLARGFVTGVTANDEYETIGYGYGFGRLETGDDGSKVVLPAGTCLYAERYGAPVGVVTDRLVFARGQAPADRSWVAGAVHTRWGEVGVWAFAESAAEDRWRRCE